MTTQEEEIKQIETEGEILTHLNKLYELLQVSDRIEAEEMLGHVAEFKAELEGDKGSSDQ